MRSLRNVFSDGVGRQVLGFRNLKRNLSLKKKNENKVKIKIMFEHKFAGFYHRAPQPFARFVFI